MKNLELKMSEESILNFCERVKGYLILIFAFVFPISLGGANVVLGLMLICWILEGRWKEKIEIIKKNRLIWIIYLIPLILIISTFFSSTITNGFFMNSGIKNEYQFVIKHFLWLNTLFLVLVTSRLDYKKILSAFLFGMFFSEVVSYLIFFDLIDWQKLKSLHLLTKRASPSDPSPFMHHSFYSIFLAVSILVIFDNLKNFKGVLKVVSFLFLVSATINLFINGGRLGQIALIFGVLIYALIKYKNYKYFIGAFFILVMIFLGAYNFSVNFKDRIDYSFRDLKVVFEHKDFHNSWGQRIAADITFIKLILNNPKRFIFGCGAGDAKEVFFNEGKKVASLEVRYLKNYAHLHNQYFQLWCDGGILGFLLIIIFFFYLYRYSPLPITAAFIGVIAFSFIGDVILYRPKTYMFVLFMSAILLSTYRETSNIGLDKR